MAAFDTTRPRYGSATLAGQIKSYTVGVFADLIAWNDARATRNALHKLTDRELEDIGLVRGDIDELYARR